MLAGIIAGALGGGAQAATDIADKEIAQRQKQENMKLENQLMMEREEAIARRQQTIRREDSKYDTVGEGADNKLKFEGRKNEVENAGVIARARGMVDVDVDKARRTKTAESEAEREGAAAYGKDKAAQAGDRAKAQAKHVEGAAGSAQAELTRIKIQEERENMALRKEYEDSKTPPERKAAIKDVLVTRGVLKPNASENDTERVVEEKEDIASGTKTRSEYTRKRNPGAPDAPQRPKPKAPYPDQTRLMGADGKTYIVRGGVPVLEGN